MQSSQVIWSRVNQVVYISLTGLMLLNRWAHRQPGSVKHTTCNITFMHPTICSKVRIYFALKVLSIVLWHICLKLYYDASSKSSFVATVIIWFAWWTGEKKGVKFDYPGNHFFLDVCYLCFTQKDFRVPAFIEFGKIGAHNKSYWTALRQLIPFTIVMSITLRHNGHCFLRFLWLGIVPTFFLLQMIRHCTFVLFMRVCAFSLYLLVVAFAVGLPNPLDIMPLLLHWNCEAQLNIGFECWTSPVFVFTS